MASTVWTTEICGVMRKRLEWRGFSIKDVEKWDNQQYDVISMLNLLDRAGNPDQFIQKVRSIFFTEQFLAEVVENWDKVLTNRLLHRVPDGL